MGVEIFLEYGKCPLKFNNFKEPKYWKEFLSNDQNKNQLIKLMLNIWQTNLTASHLTNRSLILICEKEAFHLQSTDVKYKFSQSARIKVFTRGNSYLSYREFHVSKTKKLLERSHKNSWFRYFLNFLVLH